MAANVKCVVMINWIQENVPSASRICPITPEASARSFFRLERGGVTYILMVYPDANPAEIARIQNFTELYLGAGLRVPRIHERIADRALLLEDLGDKYFQYYFKRSSIHTRREMAESAIQIISRIASIPVALTPLAHDVARQRFEMDFFITNFLPENTEDNRREELRSHLYRLTDEVSMPSTFAHRDFHSRNLIYSPIQHGIVDFQDSMAAHPLYDLVSFLWDAYLPWTPSLRSRVLAGISLPAKMKISDLEPVALQRTIKALGTFAFQIKVRHRLGYLRYVQRVVRSIEQNTYFIKLVPVHLQRLIMDFDMTVRRKGGCR